MHRRRRSACHAAGTSLPLRIWRKTDKTHDRLPENVVPLTSDCVIVFFPIDTRSPWFLLGWIIIFWRSVVHNCTKTDDFDRAEVIGICVHYVPSRATRKLFRFLRKTLNVFPMACSRTVSKLQTNRWYWSYRGGIKTNDRVIYTSHSDIASAFDRQNRLWRHTTRNPSPQVLRGQRLSSLTKCSPTTRGKSSINNIVVFNSRQ